MEGLQLRLMQFSICIQLIVWFQTPQSVGFRDSSAAAIAASAFLELSTVASSGTKYKTAAQQLISSLAANYVGSYAQTEGILVHAAGANPAWSPDNFDVTCVLTDTALFG